MGKSSRTSSGAPPPSTWAVRRTRSRTRSAFQRPHAAGPVARLSASVSPASRPSVSWSPTASATAVVVAGSSRSRRVATSGSSRWWRTIDCSTATSAGGRPIRGPMVASRSMPTVGVVAGEALADVVQERAEHQQVGPVGAGDEVGGVGGRLDQVPVDGEAVVGVALRLAPHRGPLRQHPLPEPQLVEGLDHGDGAVAGQQQVDERRPGLVGPRVGQRRRRRRQPVERGPVDAHAGRRRGRGGPQHERRVLVDRRVGGEVDLAVAQHQADADGLVAPGPEAERAGQGGVDALPGVVAAPGDGAGGPGQAPHEVVGRADAEGGGHRVLLLEQQPVPGPFGAAVQLDPGRPAGSRRR